MSVQYWVAQVVPDLMRNEPRNVGVFVQEDTRRDLKFLPSSDKVISYPLVYEQWLVYWERKFALGEIEDILKNSIYHFRVIPGGKVTDTKPDKLENVLDFLFRRLVK
jgi:hypothetical protein